MVIVITMIHLYDNNNIIIIITMVIIIMIIILIITGVGWGPNSFFFLKIS